MRILIIIALTCLYLSIPALVWAQIEQATLGNVGGELRNAELSLIHAVGDIGGRVAQGEWEVTQGFVQFFNCDNCNHDPDVGVDKAFTHPQVTLFPNPSDGQLELRGPRNLLQRYELFNMQGKRLIQSELSGNTLDHRHLPTGLYLIRTYGVDAQLTGVFYWLKH